MIVVGSVVAEAVAVVDVDVEVLVVVEVVAVVDEVVDVVVEALVVVEVVAVVDVVVEVLMIVEVLVVGVAYGTVVVMIADGVSGSSHSNDGQHCPAGGLIAVQIPTGWGGHILMAHDISPLRHWHSLQGLASVTCSPCL